MLLVQNKCHSLESDIQSCTNVMFREYVHIVKSDLGVQANGGTPNGAIESLHASAWSEVGDEVGGAEVLCFKTMINAIHRRLGVYKRHHLLTYSNIKLTIHSDILSE